MQNLFARRGQRGLRVLVSRVCLFDYSGLALLQTPRRTALQHLSYQIPTVTARSRSHPLVARSKTRCTLSNHISITDRP